MGLEQHFKGNIALFLSLSLLFLCALPRVSCGSDILWSADHETGDITQWYYPDTKEGNNGGGEYNSGIADSLASQEQAHSGVWAAKMITTTPPMSGTRLFRWNESHEYAELYYSVWYYFPERYSVPNWWDVFQWKSKAQSIDPFFILNVGNRPDGTMYFYLYDWQQRVSYDQSIKNIPIGKWFQVEAFYKCRGDETGQVTFWQNGTLLFDVRNVKTRYANGDCQWSVNNYSDDLRPIPATIYIDDAVISTSRVGPL